MMMVNKLYKKLFTKIIYTKKKKKKTLTATAIFPPSFLWLYVSLWNRNKIK